jgi:predicted enzyme related to lactoylglutathione lyase
MGQRTQYTPGTFSWTDLTTTDPEGAKKFYGELFGWEIEDMPAGPDMTYSMAKVDGKYVGAMSAQPQQQRDMGAPPTWNSYVTVQDADAAVERAKELGATAHAPAFDVMDVGRMAVLQDPQGAFFEVWQPKQHIGAQLVNGPGLMSWNELASPDLDASQSFYSGLFGWKMEPFADSPMKYFVIQNDGHGNGGMREPQPGEPPYWLVYFGTDDIDATMAKAGELGGKSLAGPMPIGESGKIAIMQDPQGAVFALFAGQFEP